MSTDISHSVAYASGYPGSLASVLPCVPCLAVILAVTSVLFAGRAYGVEPSSRPINFENDIVPVLTKYGCNNSGCHGKAEGQNGFKLSVFGFDPVADHAAIVSEGRGRRIFPGAPEQSLFLLKASGGLPHGGGVRIATDRPEYQTLLQWLASGTRFGSAEDPRVESIAITPRSSPVEMEKNVQLKVLATRNDGSQIDVSALATYQSNNEGLARVDENGRVTIGKVPGDVAVMASYLGKVDVFRALVPNPKSPNQSSSPDSFIASRLSESNTVDQHVNAKLRLLNIQPSQPADDATFLRRCYLDIIGTLPTAEESRQFLNDSSPTRRATLVDRLLERPEYADYWALKWSDLLRVNRLELGRKRAYLYYRWIHEGFATNRPLDQFARELLVAEGPVRDAPAGIFYKVVSDPRQMASTLSQAFLGVRIECAQCHHHPYDRWSQDDFYGMQAFFNEVSSQPSSRGDLIVNTGKATALHPRTGQEVLAHALGQTARSKPNAGSARKQLADWMTDKDNPFFARNLANRVWAQFMGRGLIEPVDDVRMTNPASNQELLDALANVLRTHDFDQKALIRLITSSQTYQRSSQPNESNEGDQQNYSRYPLKQIQAEVLLDAICQVTGVDEKFDGVPNGSRAIQLWDSHVPHYFLQLFGRPVRATACQCERAAEPTVAQVLHVLNSPEIQSKLEHAGGRLVKLMEMKDDALVDEMFLTFFSRHPSDREQQLGMDSLCVGNRMKALEDLAWSMMNSLEFIYNH